MKQKNSHGEKVSFGNGWQLKALMIFSLGRRIEG